MDAETAAFWESQPTCEGCKYELCFMDRRLDECPMCGHEIPVELRVET
jgi:rRNA maturation endonuclease Nob1